MTVRLDLFGSPTIHCGGESVALPFERRSQLVVFLALARSWVGRAELAAMLWPEQESKLALANLRKTLFRLQSLPWGRPIEAQGGALRFAAETDVSAFDSALREHRIADALPLRRGELLAGFDDDRSEGWSSWLDYERDRLRLAWRGAVLGRLAADIDTEEGIDLSARLLDADPLDEAALREHLSWLARAGHGARARKAYREFAERLGKDLGLAPGVELRALHDSLGTAVPPETRAAATGSPPPDDGFVGRTVELRRIADLLAQDDCRLLCLTGPGGVGKTRLAQRAMLELAPGYAHGAAFVPLEDMSSSAGLGGRLARELGIELAGSAEPLDQVAAFLRDRHTLLVLDNFEQLAADASMVERLLRACPRVRIVVTSRVRLALAMEWSFPVEGLPCPEPEDHDLVEAFDAARMFVRAARRVEPALVPEVEATAIIDICRQVEGLPLALQLAAAWTRVLSCEAIAAELRRGTGLLHVVDGAQPGRHAGIDVVFDQSWRLLNGVERDALMRLSVFREGFTAEAARAVATAPLPVLGALADKSLLRKNDTRIFMHPLVQQFAALRLGEGEVREATERAHALYYHRHLGQLRRAIEIGDRDALRQVDLELENCRLAWRWSVAHEACDVLAQSAPSLVYYFEYRGRFEEGLALLDSALATGSAGEDPKLRAMLLGEVGQLEFRMDRYADATASATRGRAAARLARDSDAQSRCLQVLGLCALRLGRHTEAMRHFQQGLDRASNGPQPRRVAVMLHNLALVEKLMGRQDEARRHFLESLARHQAHGDFVGEALSLANLGLLYAEKGELGSAVAQLKAALEICDRQGLLGTRVPILANLTGLAVKAGDEASAREYGRRTLDVAETTGNRYAASYTKLHFLRLALRRGDVQAARSDLEASLRIAVGMGRPSLLLEAISCFAEILAAQAAPDCACQVLGFVAEHPLLNMPERRQARSRLADWTAGARAERAWPGIELDELVHRIVVETDVAYAPLIATLRGTK